MLLSQVVAYLQRGEGTNFAWNDLVQKFGTEAPNLAYTPSGPRFESWKLISGNGRC